MLLIFIGICLFPFVFFDKKISNKSKQIIVLLFCCIFIFLGGFRWLTGTDWYPYYYEFLNSNYFFLSEMEIGYSFFNFLVKQITNEYTIFLLFFTFFKVYLKYKVLSSEYFIKNILFYFFLLYCIYVGDIYTTRQALSGSILFFSFLFLIKKRFFIFFILLILATSIHRTSIVFLPAFWLFHYKSSQKQLISIFLISILLGFIISNELILFSEIKIPIIGDYFLAYQEKINGYLQRGKISYTSIDIESTNILGILKKSIITFPLLLSINLINKNASPNDKYLYRGMMNLIVFGACLYFILGSFASDFKRINMYFEIFEPLSIGILIYSFKNKGNIFILIIFFSLIYFFRLYISIISFKDLLDPFYFIFDLPFYREMY